jgi:magnesium chelatase subunit H
MESSSEVSESTNPIKAILSKFSSGKEEDKINGYLKMLKIGPDLLKYIPGEKVGDLRCWLEAYRFWNQVSEHLRCAFQ